jgi:hypothetical protein
MISRQLWDANHTTATFSIDRAVLRIADGSIEFVRTDRLHGKSPMILRRTSLAIAGFGSLTKPRTFLLLAVTGWLALAPTAQATVFSREQDITDLKLGQRIKVDDGTCPAGQIKEISGAKMTESGVLRARKCIPRTGPKVK